MNVLGIDVPGRSLGGWAVYESGRDRLLRSGQIQLKPHDSERYHFLEIYELMYGLYLSPGYGWVAIEHPFLHLIAQWIGGIKMAIAIKQPDVSWYMITASSARKLVFGNAKRITRVNENGREVSAAKEFVLAQMQKYSKRPLTQHEADALLYAIAVARVQERTGA